MSDAEAIIARCTRNGLTSWQNVAAQMRRSVDSVRAQFDPTYLRAYIAMPQRDPAEDMEPDPLDVSSPHVKGPGLRIEILAVLAHQAESAEIIAIRLNRPVNSIRARLDRMLDAKLVSHDGRFPRTWSLSATGRTAHVTGCEVKVKVRV